MTRPKRLPIWALAAELAFTTLGAMMAMVVVTLVMGSGGIVDDPTPRPISAEAAARALATQRAVFLHTFVVLGALFAGVNLLAYFVSLVQPNDTRNPPATSSRLRRRLITLLLLASFVVDWLNAWLTMMFDTAGDPGSMEPLLAWIVVGAALWALFLSRSTRPGWPLHCAVGVIVVVAAETALSLLRRTFEPTLLLGVPMLAWLYLDKGLATDGVDTKPVSARPAEAAEGEMVRPAAASSDDADHRVG